jgi:hypothetical protein
LASFLSRNSPTDSTDEAKINATLTGSAVTALPPTIALAEAALVGTPSNNTNTVTAAASLVATGGVLGRPNGCYATNDATPVYVYIHTLLAQ